MSKLPLSVFIIAKNEEDRIVQAINSVAGFADEIVVVDSYSDDATVEVAKKLGAKVFQNQWPGYGAQKIFAENKCNHNWLLNIDADEELSVELQDEIKLLFKQGSKENHTYRVNIKIVNRFENKPRLFAPSNTPIRLYNKKYAGFRNSPVHDSVIAKEGKDIVIGRLKHHINHRCFRNYSHALEKINFYSSMQANDLVHKGRKIRMGRLILEPLLAFLKAYTIRRYFLLGVDGFVESYIYAFARFIRLAKAREIKKEKRKK